MSATGGVRLALALPLRSVAEVAAATRVSMFLLQSTLSIELRLVPRDRQVLVRRLPAALLVAADVDLPPGDLIARDRLDTSSSAGLSTACATGGEATYW
jgi:hypothetical protein